MIIPSQYLKEPQYLAISGRTAISGNIWKNRNIETNTKIRIYIAAVIMILLYRSGIPPRNNISAFRFFISVVSEGY
jgi:hypothetical protein